MRALPTVCSPLFTPLWPFSLRLRYSLCPLQLVANKCSIFAHIITPLHASQFRLFFVFMYFLLPLSTDLRRHKACHHCTYSSYSTHTHARLRSRQKLPSVTSDSLFPRPLNKKRKAYFEVNNICCSCSRPTGKPCSNSPSVQVCYYYIEDE